MNANRLISFYSNENNCNFSLNGYRIVLSIITRFLNNKLIECVNVIHIYLR